MASALHRHRLLAGLIAALLITAGIPGAAVSGSTAGATTIESDEVTLHDLRTWVAPKSTDLSNLSAIRTAKATGNLTRTHDGTRQDLAMVQYAEDADVPNDTLVLELRASGLEGALAARNGSAQNGSNATTRFFGLLESDAMTLRIWQTNPPPSFDSKEIHLAEYDSTHVVPDARNDTYYLVVDTTRMNVTGGSDGTLHQREEYWANLTVSANWSLSSNGRQSVTTGFAFHGPEAIVHSNGRYDDSLRKVLVAPSRNQTIRGSVSLPPGREVTVSLQAQSDDSLSLSKTVEVRNDTFDGRHRFAADFDFSDVPEGTNFTVDVRAHDRSIIDPWPPTYVVVEATTTASTTETTRTPVTTRTSTTRTATTDRPTKSTPTPTEPTSSDEPTSPGGEVPGFGVGATLAALVAVTLIARKS